MSSFFKAQLRFTSLQNSISQSLFSHYLEFLFCSILKIAVVFWFCLRNAPVMFKS